MFGTVVMCCMLWTACGGGPKEPVLTAEQQDSLTYAATGEAGGHATVDLGLSVVWAQVNLGGERVGDYGDFYAWGEVGVKEDYTDETCSTYRVYFTRIEGDASHDAAAAAWGEGWRLPTKEEMLELVDSCEWTWTAIGETTGYRVTGPSGASIFLPAAGCMNSTDHNYEFDGGYYWTGTTEDAIFLQQAHGLGFNCEKQSVEGTGRGYGQSVRAVFSD